MATSGLVRRRRLRYTKMGRQRSTVDVTGMNRDLALSRFDPKFSYENKNIRVSARDDESTMYGISNEKGTLLIEDVNVSGTIVGSFTVNEFVGFFSYDDDYDYITVYKKTGSTDFDLFLSWEGTGLDFASVDTSQQEIETVVYVEAANSIRVYWVDGVHEPRVIDFKRLNEKYGVSITESDIKADYFSFLPKISIVDSWNVKKNYNGYFFSGTVQFVVTEIVNGNESNIVYYSPLYYCSNDNENIGFAPDNLTTGNSFDISFSIEESSDTISQYMVYAIHRAVKDGTPQIFRKDVAYAQSVSVTMSGDEEAVESSYLTFKNSIVMHGVRTMEQKDGTLFMGNWNTEDERHEDRTDISVTCERHRHIDDGVFSKAGYAHKSQLALSSFDIGHFKYRERYALGYQIMDEKGHWSTPVLIKNGDSNTWEMSLSPLHGSGHIELPNFRATITNVNGVMVRPVVAYMPDSKKRTLYQGVLTPTIFCEKERVEGTCHAKFSPFSRMAVDDLAKEEKVNPSLFSFLVNDQNTSSSISAFDGNDSVVENGAYRETKATTDMSWSPLHLDEMGYESFGNAENGSSLPEWQHLKELGSMPNWNCEFQSSSIYRGLREGVHSEFVRLLQLENDLNDKFMRHDNSRYFVDTSLLTFHTPDDIVYAVAGVDKKIELIGCVHGAGFVSDTNILASTPTLWNNDVHASGGEGFVGLKPFSMTGASCAMTLPNWKSAIFPNQGNSDKGTHDSIYWAVPPFGYDDFLGLWDNGGDSSTEREDSKLIYKQLANYRYCDGTYYYADDTNFSRKTCELRKSSAITTINNTLIYRGDEDTVIAMNPIIVYVDSVRPGAFMQQTLLRLINNDRVFMLYGDAGITGVNKDALYKVNFYNAWMMVENSGSFMYSSVDGDTIANNYGEYFGWANNPGLAITGADFDDPRSWLYAAGNWAQNHIIRRSAAVNLKYKSTPHLVVNLGFSNPIENTSFYIDELFRYDWLVYDVESKTFKRTTEFNCSKKAFPKADGTVPASTDLDDPTASTGASLWLADVINNETEQDIEHPDLEAWMVAGEAVKVTDGSVDLRWVQGDWYYQRYDCLRTYPESTEDKNQVVEILSFYVETRTNLDGRYDTHRGKAFLQASPDNFGVINLSYTQQNNYFTYYMPNRFANNVYTHPCTIAWSLPKMQNAVIDTWTNITGSNILDFDSDKGDIVTLTRFNNEIYCFQPQGLSLVMYNNRTQIATTDGTPIVLANSGTVNGKQYILEHGGALHNYNVKATDSALYFVDAYNKQFNAFSQGIKPLSETLGFHSWMFGRQTCEDMIVKYDRRNFSIYIINRTDALGFNEKHTQFESFYSYENSSDVLNILEDSYILHGNRMWGVNMGEYNKFFDVYCDYYVDFVAGSQRPTDKIFDIVEFRGDLLKKDGLLYDKECPFTHIRAYNEYQTTDDVKLDFRQFMVSNLKNRFRVWRSFVPRHSLREKGKIFERIRNHYCHIVLKFEQDSISDEEKKNRRALIHDLNCDYTE